MVTSHDWIFDEAIYKLEAQRFSLSPDIQRKAVLAQERFRRAWDAKRLMSAGIIEMKEIRAQQAFNRIVFHDMLGYEDLMTDSASYSVLPEVSVPLAPHRTGGIYRSDLAFGEYSSSSASISGVLELKEPAADLLRPQGGPGYKSKKSGQQMSAVDQALEAMEAARCDWALVANMQSIMLIHGSDCGHALTYDLCKLDADGIRSFYFAFGPGGFYSVDGKPSRLQLIHDRKRRFSL